jgi:pimeloyl-ACP methyl ester carboxylesterase
MSRRAVLGGLTTVAVGAAAMWIARPPKSEGTPRVDLERQGFRRRDLPTPVGRVAVYEAGEGSPLLLLHGVGGGASSFYWYRIAPKLAQRYRVIAPDWVGFGASDHPARPILFDDYVRRTCIRRSARWLTRWPWALSLQPCATGERK